MNYIGPDIWEKLEQSPPSGDNLTARVAFPSSASRLQCALDAEGRRHFLVALCEAEEGLLDAQSRGIRVETRDLIVRGHPATRYIDITCLDIYGYPAFDLIGGELAAELSKPGVIPSEIVKRVLAKWRRFWGLLPRTALSREDAVGLFAELWFLLAWLLPAAGPSVAVQRWRGPLGSRHDFEWVGTSVEVKATTSSRGGIHWINGLDQLSPPEQGNLYLFSLQVREEAGAANTLPSLIASILQLIDSELDALSHFETILAKAGYSPAHDDEYAKLHLRIISESLYAVTKDFPRFEKRLFLTGVPAGIERVEYEINLNGFDHLIVARKPRKNDTLLG